MSIIFGILQRQKSKLMKTFSLFTLFCLILISLNSQDPCLPLWPRIQFGGIFSDYSSSEKIVVKFNTKEECPKSYVTLQNMGQSIKKTYCESIAIQTSDHMANYKTFIQRCSIDSIKFESNFTYIPYGSNSSSGFAIPFDAQPILTSVLHPNSTKTVKLIVLADWSDLHAKITEYKSVNETLDKLRIDQKPDGMMINGDLAYDLDTNNGKNYEDFLLMLSRNARYIPAFLNTGNHQHNSEDALKLFYNTFEMYGKQKKLANSINLGPLFLIGFDPYETIYKIKSVFNLRKTDPVSLAGLAEAIGNGSRTGKFMIPSAHYPLKCSADNKNCQNDTKILKDYWDLMFENNIKFYIGSHYHTYERIFPYCKNDTFSFTQSPYNFNSDSNCILSIVQGIAGNDEKIVETYPDVKDYTAALSYEKTGVGLLTVDSVKAKYQHFSSDNILTLQDEFQIVYKNKKVFLLDE